MFCCHGYMALRQLHSFPTRALPIWAAETQKLLTYGFRFFENRKFYAANQVVASPKIWKGAQDQVQVGVTEDLTLTAVRGQARQMEARLVLNKNLVAPVSKGQQLGTIEI